jgi:hypothetical protein
LKAFSVILCETKFKSLIDWIPSCEGKRNIPRKNQVRKDKDPLFLKMNKKRREFIHDYFEFRAKQGFRVILILKTNPDKVPLFLKRDLG